jgi:non-heme chloroperoxidase
MSGKGCWLAFLTPTYASRRFSETDLTEDPKRCDVPTLVLHGDDNQIVPFPDSAPLSSKLIKCAAVKVNQDAPHGLCTSHKQEVNNELLAFLQA